MKNEGKIITKPEKIAQIVYEAIVRYMRAKKSPIARKKADLYLDISQQWRVNSNGNN